MVEGTCPHCKKENPTAVRVNRDNKRHYYCKECIKERRDKIGLPRDVVSKLYNNSDSEFMVSQMRKLATLMDTTSIQPIKTKTLGEGGRPI